MLENWGPTWQYSSLSLHLLLSLFSGYLEKVLIFVPSVCLSSWTPPLDLRELELACVSVALKFWMFIIDFLLFPGTGSALASPLLTCTEGKVDSGEGWGGTALRLSQGHQSLLPFATIHEVHEVFPWRGSTRDNALNVTWTS